MSASNDTVLGVFSFDAIDRLYVEQPEIGHQLLQAFTRDVHTLLNVLATLATRHCWL